MAKVTIDATLAEEINKQFRGNAPKVLRHLHSLADNPTKGSIVGQVAGILIKEVKYEGFRFYFVTDGYKLTFYRLEELRELLIVFVRMSDKKTQQKTIEEIKNVLRSNGLSSGT